MSIEKVIYELKGYEEAGMHFEGELRALNRLADGITSGVIVAIGSYRGQADCALALHAHVPVYCIDTRQNWIGESRAFGDVDRPYWFENVMSLGLGERVRPINLPSLDVAKIWREPVSFLWIDGNHTEIEDDLNAWMPFVVDGGLVAVHDNNSPMVIEAVTNRNDIVEIERGDLTTVYRKEPLYEPYTYDNLTLMVRKGPYNHDDKYVLGEVRSYDIGDEPVRTCIDVGGHIGAFSAWIKQRNPQAEIVVVEPELSNRLLLKKNVPDDVVVFSGWVNYRNDAVLEVNPINSGCHRMIPRSEVFPGQSVIEIAGSLTLEDIMEQQEWDTLDLLKVDAEGAEVDIFQNCTDEFLMKTRYIVGEFHYGPDNFMGTIGERLKNLGFMVTAETNPHAHAVFAAVNTAWKALHQKPIEVVPDSIGGKKPGRKPKK